VSIQFQSPSYRAASSDLTIQISPLGLVELADEEFEVHGPRLNRYAMNWAFYLGYHWAQRPDLGEPQLTFNYVRALSDFITNFVFGKGVGFRSPDSTSAIVPTRLQRIWETDNKKDSVLWEAGAMGSVTGDCFIKVAYEEPWLDPAGMPHEGRVRILPLNSAFCFPEWHPHDRKRLIRFKLKYRFWGTTQEGTRQVFTYTELLTEERIEEYVNDELIDVRENPLGEIPIVHISNVAIPSSPWGMPDIQDVTVLNRTYNEVATDVVDIINYHAAPVTVITGARASNLEKGTHQTWSIPNKEAKVQNLLFDPQGIEAAIKYLDVLKRAMHEMTGVPVTALGEEQAISNTSGVALAIQYQPLMNRFKQKSTQYGEGFAEVNRMALKTLFMKEPQTLQYDPTVDPPMREDQLAVLDPMDPTTYMSTVQFQPPLPVDQLVKLNELQVKMALGLESKRGALEELGEEFPDEKLEELFKELLDDAEQQAALDYLRAMAASFTTNMTGMVSPEGPQPVPPPPANGNGNGKNGNGKGGVKSAGGPDVTSAPGGVPKLGVLPGIDLTDSTDIKKMQERIVALAHGATLPQRRVPEEDQNQER
jgi:Phage portal protein, SPP1 Gp6-like